MRLTKQQRISLGVLGVGLAALVIDKALLGSTSPAPASASSVANPVVTAASPDAPDASPVVRQGGSARLAEKLESTAGALGLKAGRASDAFALEGTWLDTTPEAIGDAPSDEPAPDRPAPPALTLTTVLAGAQGGVAVLNGKTVRVGERFALRDGREGVLLSIGEDGRSVIVGGDWGESVVEAPAPAASGGR